MRVEVRAFATLTSFLPPGTRHTAILDVPDESTIRDVTRSLGIPDEMALVALLNGRETEPGQLLKPDDVVTLFPPLAGGCAGVLSSTPEAAGSGWYTRVAAGSV